MMTKPTRPPWQILRRAFRHLGRNAAHPHPIYVKPVLAAIQAADVKAISHITGGGFYENIPRMLKEGMSAKLKRPLCLCAPFLI